MQFKDMQEVDLKLVLLSGEGIKAENLSIKPYTLAEIKKYGYTKYIQNLQWISLSIDDFINSIEDEVKKEFLEEQNEEGLLSTLDFYTKIGGQDFYETTLQAISMIFRTKDVRILDDGSIALNFVNKGIFKYDENGELYVDQKVLENLTKEELTVIHKDNFDEIVHIVKLQNYLQKPKPKEDELNPANEEVRKLQEHMRKMREKVEQVKKQQQENDGEDREVDIADIISAVSSKSHSINKLNIWDFTLYQVYDEYARLELIDNYDFSIRAIMAGAEKVDLKHWSSRL